MRDSDLPEWLAGRLNACTEIFKPDELAALRQYVASNWDPGALRWCWWFYNDLPPVTFEIFCGGSSHTTVSRL
jgi:hypothetical protein